MTVIHVDLWMYGEMARYGGEADQGSFANLNLELPEGSTVRDLLTRLEIPTEVRGISFINGELSAMPGLQPDLEHALQDNDRVAFFHLRSMWPFQYRFGAPAIEEMVKAMHENQGTHHAYNLE